MSDQLKWYVVRAVSGKEKKVKQYLEAEVNRLGISHLLPQVLIPMEKYYQMKDGKKIAKERIAYDTITTKFKNNWIWVVGAGTLSIWALWDNIQALIHGVK